MFIDLLSSLEVKPNKDWLRKIHECEDEKVLKYIIKDKDFDKNLDKEKKNIMGMLSNT